MGMKFKDSWRSASISGELAAMAAVLLLSLLSWRMVSNVATAVYLQTAPQGDPPLEAIAVPGPDPHPVGGAPDGHPSRLGHYGFFWSERAFHYRTMLMFTGGGNGDPALLRHDTWQQHPDGVNAWREYTLLMEPVYGWLYRVCGDQSRPPVEFLLLLIPLIHVLLLPLLYMCARGLKVGRASSVAAVTFYAGCTLGFQRLTGSLLLKEDFALLLLAGFLVAHVWSGRRTGWGVPVLAGILLALFLASWHLSQFLALAVLGTAALWHLKAEKPDLRTPLVYAVGAVVAGLTPSLWSRGFLLGPVIAVLAAWLGAAWLVKQQGWPRVGAFILLAVVLGSASLLNRLFSGDYSHVLGLLIEKIRHGFVRPDDPGSLPFAVRVFWAPPFNTPTWGEIQAKLGWNAWWIPLLSLWTLYVLIRGRVKSPAAGLLACQLVMLAGYLMIERLGVVYLVFAAVSIALLAGFLEQWLGERGLKPGRSSALVFVLLVAGPALNLSGNLAPVLHISSDMSQGKAVRLGTTDQAKWDDTTDLMRWITRNTPGPGSALSGHPAAFLADVGLSPELLLYCQRPMALNSQFENTGIRDRYQRYLELLFGHDEHALADFVRGLDVSYLVIKRELVDSEGPGSLAWIAGMEGFLDRDMVAVRMHLYPESLRWFKLVFENSRYRVLALAGVQTRVISLSHSCWWNPDQFTIRDGKLVDPAGDRRRLNAFLQAMDDLQTRQRQMLAGVENSWHGPRRPDLMSLQRSLVQARLDERTQSGAEALQARDRAGRLENAISARLSEIEPRSGKSLGEALGLLVGSAGTPRRGFLGWFAVNKGEPLHHAAAGQLLALAGRYGEAADQFQVAAGYFNDPVTGALPAGPGSMTRQLWLETVWWTFASGRVEEAATLARSYIAVLDAENFPGGGQVVDMLRRLSAMTP